MIWYLNLLYFLINLLIKLKYLITFSVIFLGNLPLFSKNNNLSLVTAFAVTFEFLIEF